MPAPFNCSVSLCRYHSADDDHSLSFSFSRRKTQKNNAHFLFPHILHVFVFHFRDTEDDIVISMYAHDANVCRRFQLVVTCAMAIVVVVVVLHFILCIIIFVQSFHMIRPLLFVVWCLWICNGAKIHTIYSLITVHTHTKTVHSITMEYKHTIYCYHTYVNSLSLLAVIYTVKLFRILMQFC